MSKICYVKLDTAASGIASRAIIQIEGSNHNIILGIRYLLDIHKHEIIVHTYLLIQSRKLPSGY